MYIFSRRGAVNEMDELKPMEQRNEPSTAEIVKSLGEVGDLRCDVAAYRLEQLERENDEKDVQIAALTARAESAERERDAAIGHVHDAIFGTNHSCFYCTMENCDGCTNSTVKEHFKYRALKPNKYLTIQDERGLPQEGEWK